MVLYFLSDGYFSGSSASNLLGVLFSRDLQPLPAGSLTLSQDSLNLIGSYTDPDKPRKARDARQSASI